MQGVTLEDIKNVFETLGVVTPILDEVLHNFPLNYALMEFVLEYEGETEIVQVPFWTIHSLNDPIAKKVPVLPLFFEFKNSCRVTPNGTKLKFNWQRFSGLKLMLEKGMFKLDIDCTLGGTGAHLFFNSHLVESVSRDSLRCLISQDYQKLNSLEGIVYTSETPSFFDLNLVRFFKMCLS